jgi:predicted nucleotidyltransferase
MPFAADSVRQLDLFGSAVDDRLDPTQSDLDVLVAIEALRAGAIDAQLVRLFPSA